MKRAALAPVPVVEAGIGHNLPPEPTPFERVEKRIGDLYGEAALWLDGAMVETQAHADGIGNLLNLIREAEREADEARKAENKAFDDGKAAVQKKYAPLIANTKTEKGKTVLAAEACKKALAPYLAKLEAEKAEAARIAYEEAQAKRLAANEAMRASNAANLEQRAAAEVLVKEAARAEFVAKATGKDTATVGSIGRAISLRTTYAPVMTSLTEATRHYYVSVPDEFRAFVQQLAERDVRAGRREIPGFTITETKVAV